MSAPSDRIDAATVTALLAAHLGDGWRCERIERAAVGNGQETWLLDAVDAHQQARPLVLRRSAAAGVLDDTDRGHEFATLRTIHGRGLPTPRVYWLEATASALGQPYFVMDRLPGQPPRPRSADEAASVAHDLGRRLAQLHAAAVPLADASDVRATTAHEVERWRDRYVSRQPGVLPMVGALLGWLAANLPAADAPPVLLWGDAGPHNVLVEDGRISAMLDWELSHPGHPLEDLGAALWACLGRYPEDAVVAGYEEVSCVPVDRDALAYFAVLGCVSRTVMQLAGVQSFVHGETNALNLAGLGLTLPIANLRRAAAYASWPPPHEPSPVAAPAPDDLRLRPDVSETLQGIARFLEHDVLSDTASPVLRRGLKTAVTLLQASGGRISADEQHAAELQARQLAVFDLMNDAGVPAASGSCSADALERAAAEVESDGRFAGLRPAVRAALLTDLVVRAASVADIAARYGRDVQVGPGFGRRA